MSTVDVIQSQFKETSSCIHETTPVSYICPSSPSSHSSSGSCQTNSIGNLSSGGSHCSSSQPQIAVTGDGKTVSDGETQTSTTNATNFGSTPVGTSVTETYTITNNGSAVLTLGTLSVNDTTDFSVTQPLLATVPAHGTTTFTVTYLAVTGGSQTAQISFSDNVTGKNPFTFAVSGTATVPLISVFGQPTASPPGAGSPSNPGPLNQQIIYGSTQTTTTDGTDFGTVDEGAYPPADSVTETFKITNTGNAPLKLTAPDDVTITPITAVAGDFVVTAQPAQVVAPGSYTTFQVTFTPTANAPATETATVVINNENDPTQPQPFTFQIQGEAINSNQSG